jgi:hypothetical protein
MFLALPAGAIADIIDRRRLLVSVHVLPARRSPARSRSPRGWI